MKKIIPLVLIILLSLSTVINISTVNSNSTPSFFYVGRDPTTQGNWTEQGYGDSLPKCGGYALPYTNLTNYEVALGKPCLRPKCDCGGYCEPCTITYPCNEYWWREPWSVPGINYYPYEDYLGGKSILEYEIIGPEGAPRALADKNSIYYRPSWYYNDSSITVTLTLAGKYSLAIYFLDWDAPSGGSQRKIEVKVTSSGDWDTATLGTLFTDNFAAGTYALFEVNSGGTIIIQVTNLDYPLRSAVIAGIFLDAIASPVTGVNFIGFDKETKGNWRPTYGNSYYLLPGFNVPLSGVSYKPIDKSYDETNIATGNYDVSAGTCQYAADAAKTYGMYPYIGQYASYVWTRPPADTASDKRVLFYPMDKLYYGYPPTPLNGRIYGLWDSGELGYPLNYFIIKLKIPTGKCVVSIYAMDFSNTGRSETIEVWDESLTVQLDSQYITASEINSGIYIQWYVTGPRTINIKVIADPGNLNSFINGIFVNGIGSNDMYYGRTIAFWKSNIQKALLGQMGTVPKNYIVKALDRITMLYGLGSTWDCDWLTFAGDSNAKLTQGLNILQNYGSDMQASAKAQILALLLTDTHYRKHFYPRWIDAYQGGQFRTVTGWITIILDEYKSGNYETARDLANYLNKP